MLFIVTLVCTVVVCCLLRNVIRKVPWLFYLAAVAAIVLYFAGNAVELPRSVDLALLYMLRKCMLPFALFVIVMYIGVLPKTSKARHWMQPLRAPLSIVACILVLGHMVQYFMGYVPRVFSGHAVATNIMVTFALAIVLFALLLVLGVTSFNVIKRHMNSTLWRRVQQFAYLFYALVYVHLFIILSPSAFRGSESAIVSLALYTVLFGGYLVLRVMRARQDRLSSHEVASSGEASLKGGEAIG